MDEATSRTVLAHIRQADHWDSETHSQAVGGTVRVLTPSSTKLLALS